MSTTQSRIINSKEDREQDNLDYTMNKFNCDIKYMYRTHIGHKFMLVFTDEVTNYLVPIFSYRGTSHKIRQALINHVFCKHMPPKLFNV